MQQRNHSFSRIKGPENCKNLDFPSFYYRREHSLDICIKNMKNPEKRRARGVVFSPEDRKGKTIDEKLSVGGRASHFLLLRYIYIYEGDIPQKEAILLRNGFSRRALLLQHQACGSLSLLWC